MSQKLGVRLKWLGCAGFEMDFGGLTVVSDPFITELKTTELTYENVEHCDLMVLTHGHYDHVTDIPALHQKFGALLLCGEQTAPLVAKWSNMSPMNVLPMTPGLELDFDAVKIKAIFGTHTMLEKSYQALEERARNNLFLNEHPDLLPLHKVGHMEYRNFLFTMPNGTRILHWGNPLNAYLCNLMKPEKADILIQQMTAVIPDPELLIDVCREMGTKVLIANHVDFPRDYREKAKETGARVKEALPEIRFIMPEYNRWMEF